MLIPPLEYSEIKIGDAELRYIKKEFILFVDGHAWMTFRMSDYCQVYQFQLEAEVGEGSCMLTGLGLGILPLILAQKQNVTSVTVYELNKDIIEMFYYFCNKNNVPNFVLQKIKIIEQDANTITGQNYNYGFLDHFEQESETCILNKVREISNNNNIKKLWFWPLGEIYIRWCIENDYKNDTESLIKFLITINIKNIYSDITPLTHYFATSGYTYFNIPNIDVGARSKY